jgi:sulfur-oxidizing protein SoxA
MWRSTVFACVVLAATGAAAQDAAQDARKSGFEYMGPDTQAMQTDDLANPGMLSALDGETLWNAPAGASGKSCASCHGDATASMKGVAARYPAFDAAHGLPIDLTGRINLCREANQQAPALRRESREALGLATYIGVQSRGLPVAPPDDPRLAPFREQGQALYTQRMGQLNFSCAQCHDQNAGGHLGAAPIPQAHPTGYPLYRLEWQATGSLQRRFRNCMAGVRAEPFSYGSTEFIALELFLMDRAKGMPVETPAVRP